MLKKTNNDETMKELKNVITKGWPGDKSQVAESVKPYFKHRDELAIHDALIYRGEKVIIPLVLRPVEPVSLKGKIWLKAKVLQRLDERSYLLKDNKRVFRRNRVDLRKVPNKDDSETQEKDIPVTVSYEYPKDNAQSDVQVTLGTRASKFK